MQVMRKFINMLFLICIPLLSFAQKDTLPALEAYFSAIIVKDIDASIKWYAEILGFDLINKIESEERGFKLSNLKREGVLLELIELKSALSLKDIASDYNAKTRINGLFKTGFLVSDFQAWMNHLTKNDVDFYGGVVTDPTSGKKMIIVTDPDGNRIQLFEK